jgi:hypothetical protein
MQQVKICYLIFNYFMLDCLPEFTLQHFDLTSHILKSPSSLDQGFAEKQA